VPSTLQLRDPKTGLYTVAALAEFIRYEIDGGAQTAVNESFVTPVCAVAISLDALAATTEGRRENMLDVTALAITRITRRSDRLAREGNDFVALLRRTLAKGARDHYAPKLMGAAVEATREASCFTTLSFGIASLTEHLVRDPDDMIKKAYVALDFAKRKGPGSVVVYDLREMAAETAPK
jgi:GGDEF domain-containing protein